MKKHLAAAVLLATTALSAQTFAAEPPVKTIYKGGWWQTQVMLNQDGVGQCVAVAAGTDRTRTVHQSVQVKWSADVPNRVWLAFYKEGGRDEWNFNPDGEKFDVKLQVDNAPPRVYYAEASNHKVEVTFYDEKDPVTGEYAWELITNLIASGKTLSMDFPTSRREEGWDAPLSGSGEAIKAFAGCIKGVAKAVSEQRADVNPVRGNAPRND